MNLIEQPYVTPPGKYDVPFVYVYDATSLTDGLNYQDIQIPMQGDSDFILRHIAGVDTVIDTAANGGRFNYKNASLSYANGNPTTGICFPKNWPVLPEKIYKFNESIWIDLYKVLRNTTTCGGTPIFNSFIAFFGVKRFDVGPGYVPKRTPYKYKEKPQRYEYLLTIDWNHYAVGTALQQPHRFTQHMDNYDFELLRISICEPGQTGTLLTNDFSMTLLDQSLHQTSSLPLNQGFFNAGKPTPATQPPYQGCFPVPSMVYPAGSAITFDVTSQLCNAPVPPAPQAIYDISFEGIWRIPC